MSIQNIKKALFIGILILFSQVAATAQIEKGVTTLGGSLHFDYFRGGAASTLTPSYGRFITNKILIKGKLEAIFSKNSETNNSYKIYDFSPEIQYYFNPTSQWKFFVGTSAGLTALNFNYPRSGIRNYSSHDFHQSVYVGFNKFLNKEIAFEGTLGVSHSNLSLSQDLSAFGTYGLTNLYTTGLNLSINNYVNFKSNDVDFDGLISKGRSVIDGKISLNTYTGKQYDVNNNNTIKVNGNYASLNAEYGQFVMNGLLIGVKTNLILSDNVNTLGITPYAQYFYPISKRLMVNVKAEFNYNFIKNNRFGEYKAGFGLTYFLSKNVALDVNIINFNKTFNSSNLSNNAYKSSNIGLKFFLK